MASNSKRNQQRNQQHNTPPNADPKRTTSKLSPIQRTVSNGERELDHREYGKGSDGSREAALCNENTDEDQGADEGRNDTVEGALKLFPKTPPPALFEARHLVDAAEAFWGLPEGTLAWKGKGSRKADICWPRFVVCKLLKDKGLTLEASGKILGNRNHGTILNGIRQYTALCQQLPAYNRQAVEFERYCWNTFKGYPSKKYKVGSVIT